jgi:DNA-binding NarL/FixJ family response regulator
VLLDRHLPDRDGLDVLDEMRRTYPAVPVVMLSGDKDQATISQALRRGALGFIPKSETRSVLSSALALVLAGGVYVPPAALGAEAPPLPQSAGGSQGRTSLPDAGLTERQIEVLALLMAGKNNKMICRALGLAEPTVKNHVSAILRALGVTSRMEAVAAVARREWNLPPTP